MAINLSLAVVLGKVVAWSFVIPLFSQLFSLVFIFGDTIRRAVLSLMPVGVRGLFGAGLRIAITNLGRWTVFELGVWF